MRVSFSNAMIARFLSVGLVLSTGCLAVQRGRTDEREAILQANSRWDSASVKRDPVILAELMSDDFIHVNHTGTVGTKPGVIRSLTTNRGFGYAEHRSDSVTIKIYGPTAVMNGIVTRRGDKDRRQDDGLFRFTRVWVKSARGWQVTANQYSLMTPSLNR
jgi:ketosteroid isomerase-like protein